MYSVKPRKIKNRKNPIIKSAASMMAMDEKEVAHEREEAVKNAKQNNFAGMIKHLHNLHINKIMRKPQSRGG